MNKKQYHFLAGLHRSGATLLSALLSQNPEVWATPASPLFTMIQAVGNFVESPENKDFPRSEAIKETADNLVINYYSDRKESVIIDKHLAWASPFGFYVANKFITKEPKIICCVRPILEVLASFTVLCENNPSNTLDLNVKREWKGDPLTLEKNKTSIRADYLMREDQAISLSLRGMKETSALNGGSILFIEYDDIVKSTEKEINRIVNFLDLPSFEYKYTNIKDCNSTNLLVTGIKDLHFVRSSIIKQSPEPSKVLNRYIMDKYVGMEFWRTEK